MKSVSLDKWPLDQAEFMAKIGNERANKHFEATMPEGRKPTENDSTYALENFIRDKYEKKLWVKKGSSDSGKKKKKKKVESSSESESSSSASSSDESSEDEEAKAKAKRKKEKEKKKKEKEA
ncbi:MAG: hypothetical protein ACXVO1_09570, partial [Tumebacillaceae bacterium]